MFRTAHHLFLATLAPPRLFRRTSETAGARTATPLDCAKVRDECFSSAPLPAANTCPSGGLPTSIARARSRSLSSSAAREAGPTTEMLLLASVPPTSFSSWLPWSFSSSSRSHGSQPYQQNRLLVHSLPHDTTCLGGRELSAQRNRCEGSLVLGDEEADRQASRSARQASNSGCISVLRTALLSSRLSVS